MSHGQFLAKGTGTVTVELFLLLDTYNLLLVKQQFSRKTNFYEKFEQRFHGKAGIRTEIIK